MRVIVVPAALLVLLSGSVAVAAGELPEMKGYVLGKPDAAAEVLTVNRPGEMVVSGAGRETSAHMDSGGFAGFRTEALNFTFVARIVKCDAADKGTKFGLVARAGLAGNDKAVSLRYDASETRRCLQWFMRHHVVANTHQGSRRCFIDGSDPNFAKAEGLWLRAVRRYPYVHLSASKDGATWETLPYLPVLHQAKVWVGLQVTGGGDGKKPVGVTFDKVSLALDKGEEISRDVPKTFQEYSPAGKSCTIHFARINTGTAAKPAFATSYVIIPDGLDPKKIRCVLWTPGSKEIATADGGTLAFRAGAKNTPEAGLRLPADFDKDEGAYRTDKLDPVHFMLAHHGIVRMGTLHLEYTESLRRLAEVSKIAQLAHLPFVSTGASAAGGRASTAARKFPERAVACAPTLLGATGIEEVDKHGGIPFLHIVGSKDGVHLRHIEEAAPLEREKHALWGGAPMWFVYHHTHKQMALMYPYFIDCVRLRVPADHDFSTGPARLNPLKEEDGYLGRIDTWETDFPQAVPFRDHKGDRKRTVWLPTAEVARTWQAFVSHNPRTVIHFPAFEGNNTVGQPQPNGWHNSHLAADEPFEVVASGPLAPKVQVEFFADLEPLKTVKRDAAHPYRLRAKGLPAGLHVLYAITTADGKQEISRPVTVMFHSRIAQERGRP